MISKIKKLWSWYLAVNLETVSSLGAREKIVKIRSFTAVGIAALLFFVIPVALSEGDTLAVFVYAAVIFIAFFNLLFLSRHKNSVRASSLLLVLMLVFFLYLLGFGGIDGTGALWFATFPLIAFFLEGKDRGTLWCLGFLVILGVALFYSGYSVLPIYYSSGELLQIIAAFMTCSLVVLLFESEIEAKGEDLARQTGLAHNFVERYREQYAVSERLRAEAVEALTDLKDTRKAMLNVLDDLELSRAMAEEARVKNEAILKNIGDGVIAVDEHGHIAFVNTTFEILSGWKVGDVIGKSIFEVLPFYDNDGKLVSKDRRPVFKLFNEQGGNHIRRDIQVTGSYARKDSTLMPIAATVSSLVRDGKTSGVVEVFRDVTKEKELERMRVDFLALASHQLRTPLSGTKWLIETLLRGVLGRVSRKQRVYLEDIYRSNERMIKLVVDLLNTLKLDNGGFAFRRDQIDPRVFCDDLSEGVRAAVRSKDISLVCDSSGLVTKEIFSSLEILRTILDNFLSNAINYARPKTEVRLVVRDVGGDVEFAVVDHGIGIPEGEKLKIFERFYRASNAKAQRPDGTGLGLYMSKLLAEKIGGRLSFKSEVNKGSTFTLRIPIKKE